MMNERRIGRFTVAGQPSDAELATLGAAGYSLVVNVRMPEELDEPEAPKVRAAGLRYEGVPYTGASLRREHVERLGAILEAAPPGEVLVH